MSKISPGSVKSINKPRLAAGLEPLDFGQDALTGSFNFGAGAATETPSAGVSLGAALLSLSFEESRPQLGGGLSLVALQNRRLDRIEGRVSKLEQES